LTKKLISLYFVRMFTPRALTPQQNDRNKLRQVFTYAASVIGGIAPDDLPSFQNAPLTVDWTNSIRGPRFQQSFSTYVNNSLQCFCNNEAKQLIEIIGLKDKMFDRILDFCISKDSNYSKLTAKCSINCISNY
jgi:hypothetical protein